MNRLGDATSPYLRQHADNPVDWYPWGEEAFALARATDRPILLSVGYSSCHWCHVMAHESFEDDETAALMNELFVNVKVDREERPDVDAVYMAAVQAMTGRGGWPMTVFLTPDAVPFYGGTYFPPEDRFGLPSFGKILDALADAWATRRHEVLEHAIDEVLVPDAHIAVREEIVLERAQLEALFAGHIGDGDPREIRQAGERAHRREFVGRGDDFHRLPVRLVVVFISKALKTGGVDRLRPLKRHRFI